MTCPPCTHDCNEGRNCPAGKGNNMTQDIRDVLKLALDALENASDIMDSWAQKRQDDAITAIKEALAQEQEPVAIVHRNEYNEYRLEPHDNFDIKSIPFNIDVPLFKSPQRTERPVDCERCNRLEEQAYDLVGKLRVANIKLSMRPQRTWVGLMRGVRVEGDTVVITVKGRNDAARELCGALIEEMNK